MKITLEVLEQMWEDCDDMDEMEMELALGIAVHLRRFRPSVDDPVVDQTARLILDEMALLADWMLKRGSELTPTTAQQLQHIKDDSPLFQEKAEQPA